MIKIQLYLESTYTLLDKCILSRGEKTNKDQKLILMEQRLYLINVIKPG